MTNPLKVIGELGQSVWIDHLSREFVISGKLKQMIREDGVTGLTSNPTIFEKAIGGERFYDNDIHRLVDSGLDIEAIYENLAVADIRAAADLLRPIYEGAGGSDGYVSLEVSPSLAYDTSGTLAKVRSLFELVDRKNVMIKVPATPEGLKAASELIGLGININVTLIFSLDQYQDTAETYIQGIEQLISSGGDPREVASVASFFVSRVDTTVDEMLDEISDPARASAARAVLGKTGISNAKIAYSLYKEIFSSERFLSLKEKGARPQRVLWASTSAKNPNYPDTYYVDSLIGPDTVNTMPQKTLEAFRDHGRPAAKLEEGLEEAQAVFAQLAELGIDISLVMDRLLENGVKLFADSFDKLLSEIGQKRTRLLRGWGHRSASLGNLQKRIDSTLTWCDKEKIADRLWAGDVSLWTNDPETRSAIGQRLGWLPAVEIMAGEKERLREFADEIRSAGFKHCALLGMGGSSLAPEVFGSCFGPAEGYLDIKVFDTTIPASVIGLEKSLDLKRTLFIVASKSGGTIEVMSLYKYFRGKMENLFEETAGSRFIAITDPGTSLGRLASEHGFRRAFLNPADIGGRFSALSYFGLVPAALMGMDIDRILMRASQAVEAAGAVAHSLENAGLWLGAIMAEAAKAGCDKLTLVISPRLASFAYWLEQLVAESTGKEGKGIIPIEGEPIGSPDNYGRDRIFVYLRLDDDGIYDEKISALEKAGHPVVTLRLHGPYDLGREMFRWEFATASAGIILKINPFDEPNVQESKDNTKRILNNYVREKKMPSGERWMRSDPELPASLKDFLERLKSGDYLGLNVFLPSSDENRKLLQTIRTIVRDRFRVATTLGFGPRYLHSTGQTHKGGPARCSFIQITGDDAEDVPIPGEPYSFGALKLAQALGDYEALKQKGRRVMRIHLSQETDLVKLVEVFRSI
jgi:transaldolase / glucose-6-phosphate isomerase